MTLSEPGKEGAAGSQVGAIRGGNARGQGCHYDSTDHPWVSAENRELAVRERDNLFEKNLALFTHFS